MRPNLSFCLLFLAHFAVNCLGVGAFAGNVRTVEISSNSVTPIRTAPGYSTVIEFQSKPTQAVLGDQDAFKLEYIGNSVTVKPVVPNAKSNLFIYTDYDRFTFFVSTVPPAQADYVVRVEFRPQKPEPPPKTDSKPQTKKALLNRSATSKNGFQLLVREFEKSTDPNDPRAASVLRFEISSYKNHYAFQPGSLGLRQGSKFITIQNIYLDSLELDPKLPSVKGTIALLNADWNRSLPLFLVFAVAVEKSNTVRIEVPISTFRKGVTPKNEIKRPFLFQDKSHQ